MNPTGNVYHALLIDGDSNESNLDCLYEAHELYMLDDTITRGIIMDVVRNMKYWESMAHDAGLARREISLFTDRFERGLEFQYSPGLHI